MFDIKVKTCNGGRRVRPGRRCSPRHHPRADGLRHGAQADLSRRLRHARCARSRTARRSACTAHVAASSSASAKLHLPGMRWPRSRSCLHKGRSPAALRHFGSYLQPLTSGKFHAHGKLLRRQSSSTPWKTVRSHLPWPLRWLGGALVLGFSSAIALWAFETGKDLAGPRPQRQGRAVAPARGAVRPEATSATKAQADRQHRSPTACSRPSSAPPRSGWPPSCARAKPTSSR